jgi:tripartite-type tricarboxylate transporter receptor subunit TctC
VRDARAVQRGKGGEYAGGVGARLPQRQRAPRAQRVKQRPARAKLAQQGSEPVGSTPEEFRAFVASEIPKWAELVRISGAKVE